MSLVIVQHAQAADALLVSTAVNLQELIMEGAGHSLQLPGGVHAFLADTISTLYQHGVR